jgi:hypothetical protein
VFGLRSYKELIVHLDETLRRNSDALERNAKAFERHAEAFERHDLVSREVVAELRDMRDQLRALTEATWRMIDRLDGGEATA